jgi:Xaa-Pro aminopeptidase
VAAAENGALPHATPRPDVEIPRDTLVVVDFGCVLDSYCSDCTRTFATGALDQEARDVYDLVRSAQEAALAATRVGADVRDVDRAARELIEQAGRGDQFGHGLGHGVGLEIHEAPRLAPSASGQLAAGNVVTVEPGVYVPERCGVRIEDLVLVTDDGPQVITSVPKELTTV